MASLEFEPLRVTARLRTPVVADPWLPLDGILLYQACREQLPEQAMTTPGEIDAAAAEVQLPLAVVHAGRADWYYACSWAQPQPWWAAEGQDNWNKRLDVSLASLVDFGGRRGRILTGEGTYRAYHMPIFYRVARWIEWYCVGDRAEIATLLAAMTHIGKKIAQGWGRVIEWRIEPMTEDWSVRRDGRLTRGVPMADAGNNILNALLYGLRPPYYHRENQMLIVMP